MIAAIVGLGWWYLFHRYPRWYVWAAGALPFLVVLFVFYTYLERLLPVELLTIHDSSIAASTSPASHDATGLDVQLAHDAGHRR